MVSGEVVRWVRWPAVFGGRNRAGGDRIVFERGAEARRCLGGRAQQRLERRHLATFAGPHRDPAQRIE